MRIDHNGTPQAGYTCRFEGMTQSGYFHYSHSYREKKFELMFAPEMLPEYKWIFHHFLKEMEEHPALDSILSRTSMVTKIDGAIMPMTPSDAVERIKKFLDEQDKENAAKKGAENEG